MVATSDKQKHEDRLFAFRRRINVLMKVVGPINEIEGPDGTHGSTLADYLVWCVEDASELGNKGEKVGDLVRHARHTERMDRETAD